MLDSLDVQRITNFLHIDAPPQPAQLAFVFGNSLTLPAQCAADLFHRQLVSHIVVTGGVGPRGIAEAALHLQVLTKLGVPTNHIICEERSTNTFENVEFALPLIDTKLGLTQVTALIAVAKWYHCRRALMTLKRFWPQPVRYYTATYEPNEAGCADWWQFDYGRRGVMKEWNAISTYRAQGWLADIAWDNGAFV